VSENKFYVPYSNTGQEHQAVKNKKEFLDNSGDINKIMNNGKPRVSTFF